jgi:putative membrane protein
MPLAHFSWATLWQEGTMGWSDFWPMPGMFFGPLVMIGFFIICIAMLVFVMRGGTAQRAGAGSPIDILKERYARGEINETEYEERRRVLEG